MYIPECTISQLSPLIWTIIWTSQPLLQPASYHYLLVRLKSVPYPIVDVFASNINSTRPLESPTFPFGNDQLTPSLSVSVL